MAQKASETRLKTEERAQEKDGAADDSWTMNAALETEEVQCQTKRCIGAPTVTECPECGESTAFDAGRGEGVCEGCGLVVTEETIDDGPEWRSFDDDTGQQKKRVGGTVTPAMHDRGFGSTVDWKDRDAFGRELDSNQRQQAGRLRRWQKWIRTGTGRKRSFRQAFSELNRMASALSLPKDIVEDAAYLYRKGSKEGLVKGRSIESGASACLYAAARRGDVPRSLTQMEEYSRVERRQIERTYVDLCDIAGLEMRPSRPDDYIHQIASEAGVDRRVMRHAQNILSEIQGSRCYVGKSPVSIAGAVIYAACMTMDIEMTQQEVADAAGITDATIRKHYRNILDEAEDTARNPPSKN